MYNKWEAVILRTFEERVHSKIELEHKVLIKLTRPESKPEIGRYFIIFVTKVNKNRNQLLPGRFIMTPSLATKRTGIQSLDPSSCLSLAYS